jgi:putative ABC transport system permease protein
MPVAVLKGNGGAKRGHLLRSSLVVFQFTVSVFLIFSTMVVFRQMHYVRTRELGFSKENVLVVPGVDLLGKQIGSLEHELARKAGVLSVSNTASLMGGAFSETLYQVPGTGSSEQQLVWTMIVDDHFMTTFQVPLIAGRFFSPEHPADSDSGVILNESAVRALGMSDPVGKELSLVGSGRKFTILGVMKDFHFQSLRHGIQPLALHYLGPNAVGSSLSVKIRPEDQSRTLSELDATWRKYAGSQPFEFQFFEDYFSKAYVAEERVANLFLSFSVLAILIAASGLLGLAALLTDQRRKEIGIRKILGASTSRLVLLLAKEFGRWVLLATFVALPLGYIFMSRWLEGFAYRTSIGAADFLWSGLLAGVIALLTVSYQVIKAARAKPISSLRYQ